MATSILKPVGEAVLQDVFEKGVLLPMGEWKITAPPHVLQNLKRLFRRINPISARSVTLRNSPEACRDLEWFSLRYPLTFSPKKALDAGVRTSEKKIRSVELILAPDYIPTTYALGVPLREYQAKASDMVVVNRSLLLADELGLGKTAVGVSLLSRTELGPVVIVAQPHLMQQWQREINHFIPAATSHIVRKTEPYPLPAGINAVICSYPRLRGWVDIFSRPPWKSVVFDEVQDLRHPDSKKHQAAKVISEYMEWKLGLSATPFYNYGPELFNVIEILFPGFLGSFEEFKREWCTQCAESGKEVIRDPAAFASYLSESGVFLRRTRRDVGRELPPLIETVCSIEHDPQVLDAIRGNALELARRILTGSFTEKGKATREFDTKMRMATGISKAPFVAELARMLADEGPIILYGWHRDVYTIWLDRLKELNPAMYTGTESPKQKQESIDRFMSKDTRLLILSLRSGAGLDGLQKVCNTAVFGELDWSPGVMAQCTGRIFRDGQELSSRVFYPMTDVGSDPVMAQTLGLKRAQIEGIFRHDSKLSSGGEENYEGGLKRMAEDYIRRHSHQRGIAAE
jgi:SNF2 family DNA or RNA helicase